MNNFLYETKDQLLRQFFAHKIAFFNNCKRLKRPLPFQRKLGPGAKSPFRRVGREAYFPQPPAQHPQEVRVGPRCPVNRRLRAPAAGTSWVPAFFGSVGRCSTATRSTLARSGGSPRREGGISTKGAAFYLRTRGGRGTVLTSSPHTNGAWESQTLAPDPEATRTPTAPPPPRAPSAPRHSLRPSHLFDTRRRKEQTERVWRSGRDVTKRPHTVHSGLCSHLGGGARREGQTRLPALCVSVKGAREADGVRENRFQE